MTTRVLLALSLIGCGEIAEGPFSIDGDYDRIEARLSNGDLTLVESEGQTEVVADFGGIAAPRSVGQSIEDGTLIIDYDCALCGGEVTVYVPPGTPVKADLARGDLTLERLSGSVLANVQAGGVTGIDLACDAQVSTRAGQIDMSYGFRPNTLLLETTFGQIDLTLPAGAYDFEFGGDLGVANLRNVEHDPDSPSSIAAFAQAGEISVTGE